MHKETIKQLKQITEKKNIVRRRTDNEERLLSEEESNLIRQLDSERDELVVDMYFNSYWGTNHLTIEGQHQVWVCPENPSPAGWG